MKSKMILMLIAALGFGLGSSTLRAELPAWYPSEITNLFSYDGVDETGRLVLGDIYLKLSPTLRVSTPELENAKLTDLKRGDMVQINVLPLGKRKLVDHIWVIPIEETFPGFSKNGPDVPILEAR